MKRVSFLRILLSGTNARRAEVKILFGYIIYGILGSLLLCLPFSIKGNVGIVDNLFTSISALSTTGLSTINIADSYTIFGQLVILLLIQIGGIGFMTLSSYILLISYHHINPTKKNLMDVTLARPANFTLKELIQTIIIFSLIVETLGVVALYACFRHAGVDAPFISAVFHSVSSFCTAGFSTFTTGLEQFKYNTSVNIIVSALCYLGAMGFIIVLDVWKKIRIPKYRITFTSKVIVSITLIMTVAGTTILFFTEPTFRELETGNRLLVSFFQTMTSMTTVGFNTVPIGTLSSATWMTLILLMIIGASPTGTGGGLKSTTIPTIIGLLKSKINKSEKITVFGNTIPANRANAAISTFILYVGMMFLATYLLSFTETHHTDALFFEVSSALGTVGLSTGITGDLTVFGKIIITIVMLIGRVGVVTFGAIFLHGSAVRLNSCEEDLAI